MNLISSHFRNFKKISSSKYNFSCPYCGDSEKNKRKARGYLLNDFYYCHNCNISKPFHKFLGDTDYGLYLEYLQEKVLGDTYKIPKELIRQPEKSKPNTIIQLPLISELNDIHHAKQYLMNRKIPVQWYSTLYYTDNFRAFTNTIIPNKFKHVSKSDSRIVIPCYSSNNKLIGFQGRALYATDLRYITIMLNEEDKFAFNLNRVNMNTKYYITEGPFDAMFLINAIAVAGSALNRYAINENAILVFDNEPRNKDLLKQYRKSIKSGRKVCFWPENLVGKDINEMILHSGLSAENIQRMIDDNTFSGLSAELKLSEWRKV